MADVRRLTALGMAPELATEVADQITTDTASIAWADVTGTQAGVEAAVAAKTEIAALTAGSTAAQIVAALQA